MRRTGRTPALVTFPEPSSSSTASVAQVIISVFDLPSANTVQARPWLGGPLQITISTYSDHHPSSSQGPPLFFYGTAAPPIPQMQLRWGTRTAASRFPSPTSSLPNCPITDLAFCTTLPHLVSHGSRRDTASAVPCISLHSSSCHPMPMPALSIDQNNG